MNEFIPLKDYKLITFTKDDIENIKRIKTYSKRNCRNKIETTYITQVLKNFDFGIAYFRTEILNNNVSKIRPCAFACIKFQENGNLFLLLICALKNDDKLGTNILNELFIFAKKNRYNKITLECNKDNVNFYKKFNFIEDIILNNNLISMTKNIY
jgi:hypothetical protein